MLFWKLAIALSLLATVNGFGWNRLRVREDDPASDDDKGKSEGTESSVSESVQRERLDTGDGRRESSTPADKETESKDSNSDPKERVLFGGNKGTKGNETPQGNNQEDPPKSTNDQSKNPNDENKEETETNTDNIRGGSPNSGNDQEDPSKAGEDNGSSNPEPSQSERADQPIATPSTSESDDQHETNEKSNGEGGNKTSPNERADFNETTSPEDGDGSSSSSGWKERVESRENDSTNATPDKDDNPEESENKGNVDG